jgi:hypothetical protein
LVLKEEKAGKVVAKGTPEEIADNKKVIPKFLKRIGISIFNYRKFENYYLLRTLNNTKKLLCDAVVLVYGL